MIYVIYVTGYRQCIHPYPSILCDYFSSHHWLVVSNMIFLFSIVYGMSSFPLTNSYFARWLLHHHPDNYGKIHHFQWVNPPFRLGHFLKIIVTLGFSLKIYRRSARLLQVWHPLGPTLSAQRQFPAHRRPTASIPVDPSAASA